MLSVGFVLTVLLVLDQIIALHVSETDFIHNVIPDSRQRDSLCLSFDVFNGGKIVASIAWSWRFADGEECNVKVGALVSCVLVPVVTYVRPMTPLVRAFFIVDLLEDAHGCGLPSCSCYVISPLKMG